MRLFDFPEGRLVACRLGTAGDFDTSSQPRRLVAGADLENNRNGLRYGVMVKVTVSL